MGKRQNNGRVLTVRPTDILEKEHRIIEQVISCLEKMTDLSGKQKKLDCDSAREMIEFFRAFADRFHHAKEEKHLFACLESHGMPREGGPTGVMMMEHDLGRGFVGEMDAAVFAYEKGDAAALGDFGAASRAYVSLLREHIQKEDHCLFAMVNENLSDEEQARLLAEFLAEERQCLGDKPSDYYSKKAAALGERFQVTLGSFTGCAASCCHSETGACGG